MSAPNAPVRTPPPSGQAPSPPRSERSSQGLGWGVVLIAVGALWLLSLAGVQLRWEVILPAALVAIGLLVLALGHRGEADGLIGLGVVVGIVALLSSIVPQPVAVSAGERTHTVTEAGDLEAGYTLGAGSLTLDLSDLELAAGTTRVTGRVGLGELLVRVPEDATITGQARTGMGETTALGRTVSGVGPGTVLQDDAGADAPVLELDLQVGLGQIEVTR